MLITIVGIIMFIMAVRVLISQDRAERLLYLNVIGFAVSALVALYIKTPFGAIVAITFFICSTLSANAIAYTLDRLKDEITLDYGEL